MVKIFDPGRVGSAIFGLDLENLPQKTKISQFFPLWIKMNLLGSGQKVRRSKTGQPLIYCRSKVCSGQGSSLFGALVGKNCPK